MNRFYKSILTFTIISLTSLCLKAPSNREVVDAFKAYFEQVDVDLENENIEIKNANIRSSETPIPLLSTEGRVKKTEELETQATSLLFQGWASTLCPTMGPVNQAATEFQKDNEKLTRKDISRVKGFVDDTLCRRLWVDSQSFPRNFIVGHTTLMMSLVLGLAASVASFFPAIKRRYRMWKNGNKKCTGIELETGNKQEKLSPRMRIARFAGAGLTVLSVFGLFLLRNYSIRRAKNLEKDKTTCCFSDDSGVAEGGLFEQKANSFNYLRYIPDAFCGFTRSCLNI